MKTPDIFSHVDVKRIFRYCKLRNYLHSFDTSGLYKTSQLWQCAKVTGIPFNTLKQDIRFFACMELLVKGNGFIKLNKLSKHVTKLYTLFKRYRDEIESQEKPALYFADLYKKKIIFGNVVSQAISIIKAGEDIKDEKDKRKFLKHVKHGKNRLGVKDGIKVSLRTITKIFGLSEYSTATAHRYIERMHESKIIKRRRRNKNRGFISDFLQIRKALDLYGRLTVKKGIVYERLQNSYQFNF